MTVRIKDFALVIGHAWRCYECREMLLSAPDRAWMGYKLSEDERIRANSLTNDSFRTMMDLAEATGIDIRDLEIAIDHPRARLRHVGVYKGEYNRS